MSMFCCRLEKLHQTIMADNLVCTSNKYFTILYIWNHIWFIDRHEIVKKWFLRKNTLAVNNSKCECTYLIRIITVTLLMIWYWEPDIQNGEIFTSGFQVFKHDRSDGFGGVFLAYNTAYSWREINSYNSCSCGFVASKLQLNGSKFLIKSTEASWGSALC